jgi:hypothetical protein
VSIDWDKILNMSTDVSLSGEHFPMGQLSYKKFDMTGHVQLDLFGEKLKISATGSSTVEGPANRHYYQSPMEKALIGSTCSGSSELVFDGTAGTMGIRSSGTDSGGLFSAEMAYCLVVKVPPRMIPPPSALKQKVEPYEEHIEMQLNMVNHTVDEGVVTYKSPPPSSFHKEHHFPYSEGEIQIHTDGVPIGASVRRVCDSECESKMRMYGESTGGTASAEVKFSNWNEGAGDIEIFHCVDGSSTDLSAHPEAMHSIALFQAVVEQFAQRPETEWLSLRFPDLSPLFAEQVRAINASEEDRTGTWSLLAASLAAGMSGGALVLALAKTFARKTSRDEPLLSHA